MTTATDAGAKGDTGTPTGATGADAGAKGSTGTAADEKQKSLLGGAEAAKPGESGTGKKSGEGEAKAQESSTTDLKLKFPDGVDPVVGKPFEDLAKKHGLKGEAAQEVFDTAFKMAQEAETKMESEIKETWERTRNEWIDQVKQDKEIGGAQFTENVGIAHKAVVRFGGDALVKVLDESGLGNHPEVIRAFLKVGKAISEDSISGTTGGLKSGATLGTKGKLMRDFPNSPEMWKNLPDD